MVSTRSCAKAEEPALPGTALSSQRRARESPDAVPPPAAKRVRRAEPTQAKPVVAFVSSAQVSRDDNAASLRLRLQKLQASHAALQLASTAAAASGEAALRAARDATRRAEKDAEVQRAQRRKRDAQAAVEKKKLREAQAEVVALKKRLAKSREARPASPPALPPASPPPRPTFSLLDYTLQWAPQASDGSARLPWWRVLQAALDGSAAPRFRVATVTRVWNEPLFGVHAAACDWLTHRCDRHFGHFHHRSSIAHGSLIFPQVAAPARREPHPRPPARPAVRVSPRTFHEPPAARRQRGLPLAWHQGGVRR